MACCPATDPDPNTDAVYVTNADDGTLSFLRRDGTTTKTIAVQVIGLLGSAPFVVWCGQTLSVTSLMVALTCWGVFKGMYDANIFASAFDVVPPAARGRTAGFMNMIGWLAGGGSAPVAIGVIAERTSLGAALALTSLVYVAAAALLIAGMMMVKQGDAVRSVQLLDRQSVGEGG